MVQGSGHIGMVFTKGFLAYRKCPFMKGLGLAISALGFVKSPQKAVLI